MLDSSEGQEVLARVRSIRRELMAFARESQPPVQILADDVRTILPGIAKPRPGQQETKTAMKLRYRQRQFVGAVVGMMMDDWGWEVDRQGARIPPRNTVFSTGSTFRPKPGRNS